MKIYPGDRFRITGPANSTYLAYCVEVDSPKIEVMYKCLTGTIADGTWIKFDTSDGFLSRTSSQTWTLIKRECGIKLEDL
jgi:hypothetical protein